MPLLSKVMKRPFDFFFGGGGERREKKAVSSHWLILKRDCVFVPHEEKKLFNFRNWKEQQSLSPPSHLKMTTFLLYIVFRLWF